MNLATSLILRKLHRNSKGGFDRIISFWRRGACEAGHTRSWLSSTPLRPTPCQTSVKCLRLQLGVIFNRGAPSPPTAAYPQIASVPVRCRPRIPNPCCTARGRCSGHGMARACLRSNADRLSSDYVPSSSGARAPHWHASLEGSLPRCRSTLSADQS